MPNYLSLKSLAGWAIKTEKYPGKRLSLSIMKQMNPEVPVSVLKDAQLDQTGYCDFKNKVISIKSNRPNAAIIKTLLHEVAHAISGDEGVTGEYHHDRFYKIFGRLVDEWEEWN